MTSPPTILIVDDEHNVRAMLSEWLEEEGYRVLAASGAAEGLKLFFDQRPFLSIVDLRMPGMDGFQLISRIRELSSTRILVLSALGGDNEVMRGLDVGADEYVVKPVSRGPFLARVRALLRWEHLDTGADTKYADLLLAMDMQAHSVTVRGQPVHLGPLEFKLLAYLVQQRHRLISHEELLNKVWGTELGSLDSLKWYISSLRRKLGDNPESPYFILNEPSIGYRYVPPAA